MGSGTTGVGCINTNRRFVGMELEEKYFKLAKYRITEALKNTRTEEQQTEEQTEQTL